MPPVLYHLVFQQKLRPGFSIEQIQRELQDEWQLSEHEVNQLFSAPRVVIKRNLDLLTARQYERKLFLLGLIVELERADTPSVSAINNSAPAELDGSDVVNSGPVG